MMKSALPARTRPCDRPDHPSGPDPRAKLDLDIDCVPAPLGRRWGGPRRRPKLYPATTRTALAGAALA